MTTLTHSRRDLLYSLGLTLGSAALTSLLKADEKADKKATASPPANSPPPTRRGPKPGHHPARAKACISLFMEGGPSHIDTFDPKPKLAELHMTEFQRQDRFASMMSSGKRYYVQSPFGFRQAGQCGPDDVRPVRAPGRRGR